MKKPQSIEVLSLFDTKFVKNVGTVAAMAVVRKGKDCLAINVYDDQDSGKTKTVVFPLHPSIGSLLSDPKASLEMQKPRKNQDYRWEDRMLEIAATYRGTKKPTEVGWVIYNNGNSGRGSNPCMGLLLGSEEGGSRRGWVLSLPTDRSECYCLELAQYSPLESEKKNMAVYRASNRYIPANDLSLFVNINKSIAPLLAKTFKSLGVEGVQASSHSFYKEGEWAPEVPSRKIKLTP